MSADLSRGQPAKRSGAPRWPAEKANGAIVTGNAFCDGARYRGWFVGHFVRGGSLRRTGEVEVKVTTNQKGEAQAKPVINRTALTLVLLIHGRLRLRFPSREILLRREGDYALWSAGEAHTWLVEADSRVITIRWPSRAGDQVAAAGRRARRVTLMGGKAIRRNLIPLPDVPWSGRPTARGPARGGPPAQERAP